MCLWCDSVTKRIFATRHDDLMKRRIIPCRRYWFLFSACTNLLYIRDYEKEPSDFIVHLQGSWPNPVYFDHKLATRNITQKGRLYST